MFRRTGYRLQLDITARNEALETGNTKRRFALTDLFSLYLRPRRFASQVEDSVSGTYWTLFFALVVGVASTVERIDTRIAQSEFAGKAVPFLSLEWIDSSWLNYWIIVCIGGVISGVFFWYLAGWWFQIRLRFSGAINVSATTARALSTWQFAVAAVPSVGAALFDTCVEASYLSARANVTSFSYLLVIPVFWSIWTSYSLVTATYDLKKWPALGWFVLLPLVFYLLVLGFFAALFNGFIQA